MTGREIEVLQMVAKGLGNKEIAAALNIADEYHLLKRKDKDSGVSDYQKRAHLLACALDEVLEDRRSGDLKSA